MLIDVRVIPNAKKTAITQEEGRLKVYLTARPIEGKANKALLDALSDHFDVPRSRIKIIRGDRTRDKVVEVSER
jgi:uncharacterized protein (TIGR00251 family)